MNDNWDIEHEEVVEAERKFRRICMKIQGINITPDEKQKGRTRKLFANTETRRLRPSVIDRAFQTSTPRTTQNSVIEIVSSPEISIVSISDSLPVALPVPRSDRASSTRSPNRNLSDDDEAGSSTFLRKKKARNNGGRLQEPADKITRANKNVCSEFQRADEENDTKNHQSSTSQEYTDESSILRSPRQKKSQNTRRNGRLQKGVDRIAKGIRTFGGTFNGGRKRVKRNKKEGTLPGHDTGSTQGEQLKFLSFEELQQRMVKLDLQMEREINEVCRRYRIKRQLILDAMDTKITKHCSSDVRRSTRTCRLVTRPAAGVLLLNSGSELRRYATANALPVNDSLPSRSVRKSSRVSKTSNRKISFKIRNGKTLNQFAASSTKYSVPEEGQEATIESPGDSDSDIASREKTISKTKEAHGVKTGRISKRQTAKLSQKNIRTSLENMKNTGPDGMLSSLNICEADKVRTIKSIFKNVWFKKVKNMPERRAAVFDGGPQGTVRIDAGQSKPKEVASNTVDLM